MRTKTISLLLFVASVSVVAAGQHQAAIVVLGSGAPSGKCDFRQIYLDTSNPGVTYVSPKEWVRSSATGGTPGGNPNDLQVNINGTFGGISCGTTGLVPTGSAPTLSTELTIS